MLSCLAECCDACRSIRLIEDNEADKEFFYSPIYVRKILGQGNEDFIDFDQMTIEPDTEEEVGVFFATVYS